MRNDDSFGNQNEIPNFLPTEETPVYSIYVVDEEDIDSLQSFIKQKFPNVTSFRNPSHEVVTDKETKIQLFLDKYIQKTPFDLRIFMQKGEDKDLHFRF